jgi:hypothetical protein
VLSLGRGPLKRLDEDLHERGDHSYRENELMFSPLISCHR